MACYAAANSSNWEIDPDPYIRKFDVIQSALKHLTDGRRILDIGCFNGALLKYLGDDWQKFGVEPSSDAARLAEARGIQILAPTLEAIKLAEPSFDAVLAIDVVEHVADPLDFFQRAASLVKPGGIFLVLTGDTRALAWRLQRNMYWYCSLPEHISFYNRKSLDTIGGKIGIHGVHYRRLYRSRFPIHLWCSNMLKAAAYIVGRSFGGFGVPMLRRLFVERRGPSISTAQDHLLYVFRKPQTESTRSI
jgi:SAM-dependent methyltransferase